MQSPSMPYRPLGATGIHVSALAFGAGPVPAVMTGGGLAEQVAVVRRAIEAGVNWFDTSATYGDGRSEAGLGAALHELDAAHRVHLATKVRLSPEHLDAIGEHIHASVAGSLERLGVDRVTLLQLHNAVTGARGDEPTSVTPADVLGAGGVLEAFGELRSEGLVRHIGLTGIGQPAALREVVRSGAFETMQTPYHVLNPSAGRAMPADFTEADYGAIMSDCAEQGMGVFAVRVLAGGALAGNEPSAHTLKTPFFPLPLYQRDRQRAARLATLLPPEISLKEAAIRFAVSHPAVSSAIIGFSAPAHVEEALTYLTRGPLPSDVLDRLGGSGMSTDCTDSTD